MTEPTRRMREPTGRVVGVDGCAGGWFAVWTCPDTPGLDHALYDSLDAVFAAHSSAERLLVDIPIGLTNDGPRACDQQARELLGLRGVSVFPAPCRAVVDYRQQAGVDASYERAADIQTDQLDCGISQQAWNITDKIAAMDSYLRTTDPQSTFSRAIPSAVLQCSMVGIPLPTRNQRRQAEPPGLPY